MERILSSETLKKVDETVSIAGWVNSIRKHGKLVFFDVRDREGIVQAIAGSDNADCFRIAKELKPECVVCVSGTVKKRAEKLINPDIKTGTVEIAAEKIGLVSPAETLPFDLGLKELDVNLTTLLDFRSVSLRHPKVKAIFTVQEVVIDSFRKALKAKDFFEFQAPSIISSAPEGGAEIFEVKYFGYKAYLAQSPQLYKSLLVSAFERVFSVNKVFRAEPSVTTRHLAEFISLDAEFGFINSWLDVKDMTEYVVKYILREVESQCADELELFGATVPMVSEKIPYVKLREAQEIIYTRTGRDCRSEKDPSPEDEREICKWAKETKGSDLVFISHYPTKTRPFYTYPDEENPEYNQGFDLIGRGVEWVTGGRRIHNYTTLLEHAKKWGINPKNIELYLQAFRYGMPPLGGFALGAERITMHILGLQNIREATLFPRDMERVDVRLSTVQSSHKEQKNKEQKNVFEEITALFKENDCSYKLVEHKPVFTCEEAASVRGTSCEQGAKALLMIADKKPILLVLPGSKKIDSKKVKENVGVSHLRMATPEEVQEITGVAIGAVPPLGIIFGIPTYFDLSLPQNKEVAFNAGEHTKSLIVSYADLEKVAKPILCDFSQA